MFYHNDSLGSSIFVSDINGEVVAMTNFNEWGNIERCDLVEIGKKQLNLAQSYTGYDFDDILDVYYAKARLYNSRDKRFLSEDIVKGVLQNPMTLVAYNYVLDNPLKYTDPTGLYYILKQMKISKETGIFKVEKDTFSNQTMKWGTSNIIPIIGPAISDNIDSITSASVSYGGIYYIPVGGSSFTRTDYLELAESQYVNSVLENGIEALGDTDWKQVAKDAAVFVAAVLAAGDAINRVDLLNNDERLFKMMEVLGISNEFDGYNNAMNTMNNLQSRVDEYPEYFKELRIDKST